MLSWRTTFRGGQSNIQFEHPELEMLGSFAAGNKKNMSGFQREHEG